MDPWPFVIGAYVLGVGGTIALSVGSWIAMRRAERAAREIGGRS